MGSANVLLMLLFTVLFVSFGSCSNSSCVETERKALMDFKGSLVDEGNILSSWTGRDCCSWYGITCHNHTGFVQEIHLSSTSYYNTLGGHINSSLLQLEHLEHLDLSFNDFSGIPIPSFLGSLRNLQYLDLHGANFSGEIPQQLGNLSNLHHLSLGYSYMSSTPLNSKRLSWITGLSSLTSLELFKVNLSECVDWLDSINMLSSLSSLTLRRSGLVAMAPSLDLNLTSLVSVDLSGNNFNSAFPKSLFNLSCLEHIDISENGLQGPIPNMFHKLPSLKSLHLSLNSFSSSIPDSLCTLTALTNLGLTSSGLHGSIPFCLGNLTNLTTLYLEANQLSGTIPSELGSLTQLTELGLSYNQLYGKIPSTLEGLTKLRTLDIAHNSLMGELSESFFKGLEYLDRLDISRNQFITLNVSSQWIPPFQLEFLDMDSVFIGTPFPAWLQTQTNLDYLSLRNTSISGAIPDWCLTSFLNLTVVDLSRNFLIGPIPTFNKAAITYLILSDNQKLFIPTFLLSNKAAIPSFNKLRTLDIAHNYLTGELSESFFEGLKSLEILDISRNQFITLNVSSQWIPPFQAQVLDMDSVFIGTPFPAWLQTQTNLYYLSLRNTSISGAIPDWCHSYPHLDIFDLSRNFLTGPIPTFNKAAIRYLELSSNQFSGNIPDALCNLHSMYQLNLANNQLVGRIPSCLGNLKNLMELDLANNSLSDHIPRELGNLYNLFVLRLNGNKLFGELPSSLQNLTALASLDLGKNELEGFIPRWIGKEFLYLEHLMLQSNKFSGEISVNLCQSPSLHILNLADNSLVGTIPPCLGNLSKMMSSDYGQVMRSYDDTPLAIITKGIELEYSFSLNYAKFISLSGNQLHGEIPDQLTDLTELQSLNLSNNELSGKIPERIGNMKHLESLDLSRNRLSGTIPQSLADIDDLGYLKLSFNNLSGRIPSGAHFDTFDDPSIYQGNGELCGKPTRKSCDDDDDLVSMKQNGHVSDDDGFFEMEWTYAGIGPGFAVGFLGVFCILFFKSSWRYMYFRFLENVYHRF